MANKRILKDMRLETKCENQDYCPLEALLASMQDRVLEQHKLVEYYKFRLGEEGKPNLTWEQAYQIWIENGYAKQFSVIYSPDKNYKQMRKELFNK